MKLWHGIFSTRKDLEGVFHCYGGTVKLVHATLGLGVRKGIEKKFHN